MQIRNINEKPARYRLSRNAKTTTTTKHTHKQKIKSNMSHLIKLILKKPKKRESERESE